MAPLNCVCPSWPNKTKNKNKNKGEKFERVEPSGNEKKLNALHVKLDPVQTSSEMNEMRSTSFGVPVTFCVPGSSRCSVKVMNHESPVAADSGEVDYEGGDEHDGAARLDRDSEFNFQVCFEHSNGEQRQTLRGVNYSCSLNIDGDAEHSNAEAMFEMDSSGHLSDPGTGKARFWASPELKRSCSSLAIRSVSLELEECKSYEDMQMLAEMHATGNPGGDGASPVSIKTRSSADKVMLKKHSSSQILPSGSRKLWWKLFLWKLFLSELEARPVNQRGGCSSDTVVPKHAIGPRNLRSPRKIVRKGATAGASSSSRRSSAAVGTRHKSKHRSRSHPRIHSNLREKA